MQSESTESVLKQAHAHALYVFLRAAGDPGAEADAMLRLDSGYLPAHLLRVAIAVCAKDAAATPMLMAALADAERAAVQPDAQARFHLTAARAWLAGKPLIAAEVYASALRANARDLLALRLAQSCYFYLGGRAALRRVAEGVLPAWSRDTPGYEHVLAMTAFALGENGEPWRAEALCLEALAIQPEFPYAIHAMAHVLHERAQHRRGVEWMRRHEAQWRAGGRMVGHNAWHLAMFELGCGNRDEALAILDGTLMPLAAVSASDAADATALLWQLQLEGVLPGSRWQALSQCWSALIVPGFSPFLDLHAAIAFHCAGSHYRAQALAGAIESGARGASFPEQTARAVTLRGLPAIGAFSVGAYFDARALLGEFTAARERLGASHAQEHLFDRMLHEAERRLALTLGEPALAAA